MAKRIEFGGGGGGGQQSYNNTPQSIFTKDTVEALIGVSEGKIFGPVDGLKSIYFDETPIVDQSGSNNFDDVTITFLPGEATPTVIKSALGGFGSSTDVGPEFSPNVPITRNGRFNNIDFIELRLLISSLQRNDEKGTYPAEVQFKVEIKPNSSATWEPAWGESIAAEQNPAFTGGTGLIGRTIGKLVYSMQWVFIEAHAGTSAPTSISALWLKTNENNRPYRYANGPWNAASTSETTHYWTFVQSGLTRRAYKPGSSAASLVANSTSDAPRQGDIWVEQATNTVLYHNGSSWQNSGSALFRGVNVSSNGIFRINQRVASNTVEEIRLPVARINEVYNIRVTQLTDPPDGTSIVIYWESFQEVKDAELAFPNTATLQVVARSSNQFSRLPTIQGVYKGLYVKVPTNFNPVTRVYTGVWDGTYKMEWTDSVPWIFMDFVENERYGLSRLYPHVCNKWSIYDWAIWSDEMISNGAGGTRPRFTFNHTQKDQVAAKEFAQMIAGAGAARYVDDGNGFVEVLVDKDSPAVAIFTPENVVDGLFSYSYTDPQTRPNEVYVKFKNPDLFYAPDTRRISDDDDIEEVGLITTTFEAVGCRNEHEAICRARYRMITGKTETEIVSFKTNRKGRYIRPYDIILVADDEHGNGLHGRIKSQSGSTITLRDPIMLETGFTYKIMFDLVNPNYPDTSSDPFVVVERTITNGPGTHTTLNLSSSPGPLPELAAFSIGTTGGVGAPKAYRILDISSPEGEADNIVITALQVNRTKWVTIEDGVTPTPSVGGTFFIDTLRPPTVPNIVANLIQLQTTSTVEYTLTWTGSTTRWISGYRIYRSTDGGPFQLVSTTAENYINFRDLPSGEHLFSISAFGPDPRTGIVQESRPALLSYSYEGVVRPVAGLSNLQLVGNATTTYDLEAPTIDFLESTDPLHSHYEITVKDGVTLATLRTERTQVSQWTYFYEQQRQDGLRRSLQIEARDVDQYGNKSAPAVLTATNPSPAVPSAVNIRPSAGGMQLNVIPSTERDVAGMLVWVSQTNNFNPESTTPTFDVRSTNVVFLAMDPGDVRYVRVAYYDTYGKTSLNISEQIDVTCPRISSDNLTQELQDQINAAVEQEVVDELTELQLRAIVTHQTSMRRLESLGFVNGTPLQTTLTTIGARIDSAEASIATESTARASADSSFASQLTSLTSTVAGKADSSALTALTTRVTTAENSITSQSSSITSLTSSLAGKADSSALNALTTRVTSAEGSITSLTTSVTSINSSLTGKADASALTALTTRVTSAEGSITSQSSSISSLTSSVGSLQSSVTTQASAISTLNSSTAWWETVVAASGGDVASVRLKAGQTGSYLDLVATVLRLANVSNGAIVEVMRAIDGFAFFSNPVSIQVAGAKLTLGPSFGSSNQFVMWFGPNVPFSSMTETNAIFYLKNNGSAYFGGNLSAGVLTNKITTSSLANNATAETATFGSNGGTITVTLSYSYSSFGAEYFGQPANGAAISAQILLQRSINGGAFTTVATLNTSGNVVYQPSLESGNYVTEDLGGSLTYTDPSLSTQSRQYRAVLNARSVYGDDTTPQYILSQLISIVCVEN